MTKNKFFPGVLVLCHRKSVCERMNIPRILNTEATLKVCHQAAIKRGRVAKFTLQIQFQIAFYY
jgi:hypothetical protein